MRFVSSVQQGIHVPPYVVCFERMRLMSGHHRCAANVVLDNMGMPTFMRIDVLDLKLIQAADPQWFKRYG